MRTHAIHAQLARLALSIPAEGALRREVIAAVDERDVIEPR